MDSHNISKERHGDQLEEMEPLTVKMEWLCFFQCQWMSELPIAELVILWVNIQIKASGDATVLRYPFSIFNTPLFGDFKEKSVTKWLSIALFMRTSKSQVFFKF